MAVAKEQEVKKIPPPGRKLSMVEARKLVHKQFGATLAKFAK